MWTFSRLLILVTAALSTLSGCASLGNASMVDMAVSHNETVDRIERSTLLLNILRAAHEEALTFTTISYVSGNGSVNSNVNLNDSRRTLLGSPFSFGAGGGISVNSGFSYTLNSLDSEQFNRSFLAEISVDRLLYLHEGTSLSNSVLWTLVAQSFEVSGLRDGSSATTATVTNSLDPKDWSAFQSLAAQALRLGLSLEEVPEEVPVGPRMSRDEAIYQIGTVINGWNASSWGPPVAGAAKPKLVELGGPDSARTHQLVMVGSKVRYCFRPAKIEEWPYDGESLCRSGSTLRSWLALQAERKGQASPPPAIPIKLQDISLRSPREVFYFLGQVVRPQLDQTGSTPALIMSVEAQQPAKPLIQVACGKPIPQDALAAATHRGLACHIPRDGNSYSAHVMQYLGLLVTLSKIPGAVPTSPAVLLK